MQKRYIFSAISSQVDLKLAEDLRVGTGNSYMFCFEDSIICLHFVKINKQNINDRFLKIGLQGYVLGRGKGIHQVSKHSAFIRPKKPMEYVLFVYVYEM